MEQKSDVSYRAEKLYKNSREKFGYLIRETMSNSIHSTLIRQSKEDERNYFPKVEITINIEEELTNIVIEDNGEGFTELNRKYFSHLDLRNDEKIKFHLHPQGQGRLAIIYFSDHAKYKSTYLSENGNLKIKEFDYPNKELPLFDIEKEEGTDTSDSEIKTVLLLSLMNTQTVKRSQTFFNKYNDIDKLENWFIENFFPFFIDNEKLSLVITLNGFSSTINRSKIEEKIKNVPFSIITLDGTDEKNDFVLWLVKNEDTPKSKNIVTCFARQLKAELEEGKIEYEIDLPVSYDWFLTSEYFDKKVDQKGDRIEISSIDVNLIQITMTSELNKYFIKEISKNQETNEKNVRKVKEKYRSISVFVDEKTTTKTNRILEEKDILNSAIENKGKAEKQYWTNTETENEDTEKLLNSSLNIYIDYRNRVLTKLQNLIKKFDEDGVDKNEPEDDIHDLFLKRGKTLNDSDNINNLHNLWILDNKYTVFSKTFKAMSTKKGQELSDIYLWIDDPERVKELLILELKSTTKSHNAGNKYESMVAQVKRYATQFFMNPVKVLNWEINPNEILYTGIILTKRSDVLKEVRSNNIGGVPNRIPFLKSSYYFNEKFSVGSNESMLPDHRDIRIEMYSYEDIYELAKTRNTVFFKLLNGEYLLKKEEE